jgi:hypothetical protein
MTDKIGLGSELGRRTGAVMAAEGVGIVASLGSLLVVKKIVGPERIAAAKERIAMDVILPLMNRTESAITRFQNGRGNKAGQDPNGIYDDKPEELLDKAGSASGASILKDKKSASEIFGDEHLSREDKARKYADTVLDMTIMVPVGVLSRILAQKKADNVFGAPDVPHKRKFFGVEDTYWYAKVPDAIAGQTSLVAMNTVAQAPTKAVVGVVEKVLQSVGVPQVSANSMAKYLVYVQGSNTIGNFANVGYVTAVSRQKQQDAITPPSPVHTR